MRTISDLSVWAFVWLSVGCAGQDMESRLEQSEDPPATGGVVADLFGLRWELEGNQTLVLAIETDLPEDAEVLVSVSRIYYTIGDTETYSQEYYSDRGTVRHWQQPRRIALDAERWKNDLREHQDMLASISRDMAIEMERISESVEVRAVLHANQQGPRFGGRGNPLLSGKAVASRSATFNIIESEEVFHLPLVGSPPPRKSRRAPWDGLESGQRYELTQETPLMANRERKEGIGLDFLQTMRYLPAGTVILVTDVDRSESAPWYEVTLDGDRSVTGWINSIALMNQDITARDDDPRFPG